MYRISKLGNFYSLKTAAAESIITSTTTARIEDETTSPQSLFIQPEPQVRFDLYLIFDFIHNVIFIL